MPNWFHPVADGDAQWACLACPRPAECCTVPDAGRGVLAGSGRVAVRAAAAGSDPRCQCGAGRALREFGARLIDGACRWAALTSIPVTCRPLAARLGSRPRAGRVFFQGPPGALFFLQMPVIPARGIVDISLYYVSNCAATNIHSGTSGVEID